MNLKSWSISSLDACHWILLSVIAVTIIHSTHKVGILHFLLKHLLKDREVLFAGCYDAGLVKLTGDRFAVFDLRVNGECDPHDWFLPTVRADQVFPVDEVHESHQNVYPIMTKD